MLSLLNDVVRREISGLKRETATADVSLHDGEDELEWSGVDAHIGKSKSKPDDVLDSDESNSALDKDAFIGAPEMYP